MAEGLFARPEVYTGWTSLIKPIPLTELPNDPLLIGPLSTSPGGCKRSVEELGVNLE